MLSVLVACGGGADDAGSAKTAHGAGDKDFAAYAASHGIQTLEGGGEAAEVTATADPAGQQTSYRVIDANAGDAALA